MFKHFDGTDKKMREAQKQCLDFLTDNWHKTNIFVINAPTASGKSALARAIQLETNADIVTINNQLVRQFVNEYPSTTAVIGRKHYLSVEKYKRSRGLLFTKHREAVFNPVSFALCENLVGTVRSDVVILDEADQHLSLLLEVVSTPITLSKSEFDKSAPTSSSLKQILEKRIKKNQVKLGKTEDNRELLYDEQASMRNLVSILENDSETLAVTKFIDEKAKSAKSKYKMKITPIALPINFLKNLYDGRKVIMLSGSIFKYDVPDIVGCSRDFMYYEVDSPIPVKNRLIKYEPLEEPLGYGFDVEKVAGNLGELLDRYPIRPAVIHTTYGDSEKLREFLPNCKFNTKENKDQCVEDLNNSNHTILASGMFTGVDFKDDKCRLNIVLKAQYPSLCSLWVKKKATLNPRWYRLQTIRHLIQAAGRSTRTLEDFSTTLICDDRLIDLIMQEWDDIPKYFKEALIFGEPSKLVD